MAPTTSLASAPRAEPDLRSEQEAADLLHRALQRAEHRRKVHTFGQLEAGDLQPAQTAAKAGEPTAHAGAHCVDDLGGHRVTDRLPHRQGALDPLGATPAGQLFGGAAEARQGGGVIEPVIGQPTGLADGVLLLAGGRPAVF